MIDPAFPKSVNKKEKTMKKVCALLLALILTVSCAALAETLPEAEENAVVTAEEIQMYLDRLGDEVAALGNSTVKEHSEGLSVVSFPGGEMLIAGQEMTADAPVLLATLTSPEAQDLRGLKVGDYLMDVLALYPNDNPTLSGTYYDATLYISGEKPEAHLGYLLRDGQRVESVTFDALTWQEAGVAVTSVIYKLDQNMVTQIIVGSLGAKISEDEALGYIDESAMIQEITEYFAYPLSENGQELAPLEREDLSIRARDGVTLDFIDLTAEAMTGAFGAPLVDEWTEDSNGDQLRTMQWDGLSLLLAYDAQKNFLRVDSLTVNDDVAEGPRGVRIGDFLDYVIYRFRHVEEFEEDGRVFLYGDGETAPYGVISYSPESTELTYALAVNEKTVLWHLTFGSGRLESMRLLLR